MSISTRAALKKAIQSAEVTASLLRQPGFNQMGMGERQRMATLFEELAGVARRLLVVRRANDPSDRA